MNSISILQDTLKNEMELFRTRLGSIAIVDIGTIESVDDKGRAFVHGSSFIGGEQVKYQEAEIVFPGNNSGVYGVDCVGAVCLIFIPCSCMPDIRSTDVRLTAMSFDKAGVKVMPIGNGVDSTVKMTRTDDGEICIDTPQYDIMITQDSVSIVTDDGSASVALSSQSIDVLKQSDNGTYYRTLGDGQVTTTWLSKNKDVQWTDTLNSDGSRSFVQRDPRDDQADPLFSITIGSDGTASLSLAKGLALETKDALTLKGKSVNIESTDGKTTLKSSDNVDVTTGTSKKFTVNGTNLEVS